MSKDTDLITAISANNITAARKLAKVEAFARELVATGNVSPDRSIAKARMLLNLPEELPAAEDIAAPLRPI